MIPVILAVLAAAPAPASPEKTFAIMGGTVMTAGPQGTIPNGTVIVRGRRILAVGAGLPLPPGTPVINATGQYVMPGIIDAHSHTAAEQNVNECTDVITAEVRVADVIDHRLPGVLRGVVGTVGEAMPAQIDGDRAPPCRRQRSRQVAPRICRTPPPVQQHDRGCLHIACLHNPHPLTVGQRHPTCRGRRILRWVHRIRRQRHCASR